jgi:CRISPR-associated exonuclease Cas4
MSAVADAPLPLRVHDLKQWAYCPRIVFYNYITPVGMKRTYKMQHGRRAEEAIDRLEKRRKLSEFGLAEGRRQFHVWCNSHRLGLSGKLDLLIDSPAGLFPVDFKASERSVHANHIVQLSGYALLLEEKFQRTVERGFIFLIPTEEIVSIEITPERKQGALVLIDEIRSAIVRGAMPPATELRARCENCEYRNYCGDIF